jgi:hypothetical protein
MTLVRDGSSTGREGSNLKKTNIECCRRFWKLALEPVMARLLALQTKIDAAASGCCRLVVIYCAIPFSRRTIPCCLVAISAAVNSSCAFCARYSLHRHAPGTGRTSPWYPLCRIIFSSGYPYVSGLETLLCMFHQTYPKSPRGQLTSRPGRPANEMLLGNFVR